MKGYALLHDTFYTNVKYETGKTYEIVFEDEDGKIELYKQGFHFITKPEDSLFIQNFKKEFVLFEIEALGNIKFLGRSDAMKFLNYIDAVDLYVTDKIKINRIIPKNEYSSIFKNYEFDENGDIILYSDRQGSKTGYKFDKNGVLCWRKKPYGEAEQFFYDDFGRLIKFTTYFGDKIKYEYNNKGQIILAKRLTKKTNKILIYKYEYNEHGDVIRRTCSNGGVLNFEYKYDKDGNKIYEKLSDYEIKEYKYDKNGNIIWKKMSDVQIYKYSPYKVISYENKN